MHLIGLVSDGGVHSSDRHIKALTELAAKEGVEDLVVHAFTDGRDTGAQERREDARDGAGWLEEAGVGRIGSVIGRYFAMDRDTRWDRTRRPSSCCGAAGRARGGVRRGSVHTGL